MNVGKASLCRRSEHARTQKGPNVWPASPPQPLIRRSRPDSPTSRQYPGAYARRLRFERLEDRLALAVFNPLAATVDGDAGSLRANIITANGNDANNTINLKAGIYNSRWTLSVRRTPRRKGTSI